MDKERLTQPSAAFQLGAGMVIKGWDKGWRA